MRGRSVPSVLVAMVAVVMSMLALSAGPVSARDYDCGDFSTQAQAQSHLLAGDPYRLDGDHDGVACETLPCPCSTGTGHPAAQPGSGGARTLRQRARVVHVVDGDTVDVRLVGGRHLRVRVIGIDTPEVYGGVQCYGRRASRTTKRLLPVGTPVRLASDPSQARTDRYGRALRYVAKGRIDVGRRLVYLGAARVYVYAHKPFRRTASYRSAAHDARLHGRGLWGRC